MFHLITGGAGSGKSAYAEEQIELLGPAPRIYIATMQPFDEESRQRIFRHQAMRDRKCFETIECYTGLKHLLLPKRGNVLLECMSNLTANEMFSETGAKEDTVSEIAEGILHLLGQCENLIVVTNEIFSDGICYEKETVRYQEYLGELNRRLAKWADCVTEVVYGIPLPCKRLQETGETNK